MQRLFSMFPRGAPGLALALLRLAVVAGLFLIASPLEGVDQGWWLPFVLVVSLALCLGLLTPIAATITLLFHAISLVRANDPHIATTTASVLATVALALLGPGAYSIDAVKFGRRVVVVAGPKDTGDGSTDKE